MSHGQGTLAQGSDSLNYRDLLTFLLGRARGELPMPSID